MNNDDKLIFEISKKGKRGFTLPSKNNFYLGIENNLDKKFLTETGAFSLKSSISIFPIFVFTITFVFFAIRAVDVSIKTAIMNNVFFILNLSVF